MNFLTQFEISVSEYHVIYTLKKSFCPPPTPIKRQAVWQMILPKRNLGNMDSLYIPKYNSLSNTSGRFVY